jgi:hypothetical protein
MGRLLIAVAGLLYACYCAQCWSTARGTDKKRVKRVDIPRWEDEGGSPHPDAQRSAPGDQPQAG